MPSAPARHRREILAVGLARDGRVEDAGAVARLAAAAGSATDCFLFCPGGLHEAATVRLEVARFFALLDVVLAPLRERIAPLRVGLLWPSPPFTAIPPTRGGGLWPALGRRIAGRRTHGALALLRDLCAAEIAKAPEEEAELDALAERLARAGGGRRGPLRSALQALSVWVLQRRAGEVGERFGRERLAPVWRALSPPPRLHLIGHSFGARLVASLVLGGVEPASVTLLRAGFSAFAFAPRVPGFDGPGFYHRVIAERRVDGPIVVLRRARGPASHASARAIGERGGTSRSARSAGGRGRTAIVAASALGAVGARGVGAPELPLRLVPLTGIPRYPVVNIDGSDVLEESAWESDPLGDLLRSEIATLIAMAAGLLVGGPRPVPLDPLRRR